MKKKILALALSFSTIFSAVVGTNMTTFAKEATTLQTAATAENLTVTAAYPTSDSAEWYKNWKGSESDLYGYTEFCLRYQEESLPFPCLTFYCTYYQFDASHPIPYNYVPTDIGTVITRHLTNDMEGSYYTITMCSAQGNVNPCYTDTGVPYIRNFDVVDVEGKKAHFYYGAAQMPNSTDKFVEGVSYWYVPELDMSYGIIVNQNLTKDANYDVNYFYYDTMFAVDGCYNPIPNYYAINGIPANVNYQEYFKDCFPEHFGISY